MISTIIDPDGMPGLKYQWHRNNIPISNTLTDGLGGLDGLSHPDSLCISPDGLYVYVTGKDDNSISGFKRNPDTGALKYLFSLFNNQNFIEGLNQPMDVEISPNGKHLYVTATGDKSISWYERDEIDGTLTYSGILKNGINGVDGLDGEILLMKISNDNAHIYVTSNSNNSVSWFARNEIDGSLTFIDLLKDGLNGSQFLNGASYVTLTNSGQHAYVISSRDDTLSWYDRNSSTGRLSFKGKISANIDIPNSFYNASFVAISTNGTKIFLIGSGGLTWFDRNTTNGFLSYSGSLNNENGDLPQLANAIEVSISADDSYIYITSSNNFVSWFEYNTTTGNVQFLGSLKNGVDGVDGIGGALDIEISPDGLFAYVTGSNSNAVSWFRRNPLTGSLSYFTANEQNYLITEKDGGTHLSVKLSYRTGRTIHSFSSPNYLINKSPTDLNKTALLTIAENQLIGTVVGEFNATDPDVNATLTYHLVDGNGSTDNSLFTLQSNGTLKTATTFDYERNASTYSIRVQARDEYNASVEGNFTVTLTDVFENQVPSAISIQFASLTENQPIGTVVGKLNAVDPEAGLVRYSLVNGLGAMGNQFFTVDPTGVLRTAVVFDFEQNASHSIRGRAMDEFNASREEVLNIQVSNQWEDPDGDGLENSYDPDDDNDGFSDIVEIAYGSDPLDPNSLPNRAPSEISLSSDRVEENMPIGTMVGQLRTIDGDDPNGTGVYQYSFHY